MHPGTHLDSMTHYRSAEEAIRALDIRESHTVLDLGCGDGYHLRLAGHRRPKLAVAADIDFASLRRCGLEMRGETCEDARRAFVVSDALRLPFSSGSFDRVICSLVLYLLPLRNSMEELHRVVKPGGKVYLRVPMLSGGRALAVFKEMPNMRRFAYGAFHVLNGVYFALAGRQCDFTPTTACYLPRRRFEETARAVGFEFGEVQVDRTRPRQPSIEAWLDKV